MIIGRCNSSENSRNRYDETFCIFSFMQDADGIWRVHLKFCCKIILMIVFLISFFWFFYAIYTYINQGQHVGLFVFVGVFFAAIGIMGIISCYTRYFEIDPNNKIIVYGAYNKKYSKNRANFKSIGSLVLITCFFVRQNRFGALIQTFSQKTAKNQISGRFPPLPSTRDVLDILLFTSA